MEVLRQYKALKPDEESKDGEIMKMSKQDVFNEYCKWNGLLNGYELPNVIEDIYDINLQQ